MSCSVFTTDGPSASSAPRTKSRAQSETRRTCDRRRDGAGGIVVARRSSSSSSTSCGLDEGRNHTNASAKTDPTAVLALRLQRLKVSPLSESQRRRRRQQKQKQLRNKIKKALADGTLQTLKSQSQDSASHAPMPPFTSPQISQEAMVRHRHASDSSTSAPSMFRASKLNFSPTSNAISTQSLQDFSDIAKCCENLETFSICEEAKAKERRRYQTQNFLAPRVRDIEDLERQEDADCGMQAPSQASNSNSNGSSCAQQARQEYHEVITVNDLAGYLEDSIVFFPKKMSQMAEMMYT